MTYAEIQDLIGKVLADASTLTAARDREDFDAFTAEGSLLLEALADAAPTLARQQQRALESEAGYVSWARGKGHRDRPSCPWHELSGAPLPPWPEREKPQGRCPRCRQPATYQIIAGGALTLTSSDGTPHTC